jgi:hypothetical protein
MYTITITAVSSIGVGASQSFTIYVVTTTPPVAVPPEVLKLQRKGTAKQPTQLILSFDQPMDLGPADLTDNYIIEPVVRGKVLNDPRQRIHVAKAVYAPNGESVALTVAKRLPLNQVFQITVNGHAPAGLSSALGVLLDGNGAGAPGSDLVMRFTGQASLAGIPGPGQPLPIAVRSTRSPLPAGIDLPMARTGLSGIPRPSVMHPARVLRSRHGRGACVLIATPRTRATGRESVQIIDTLQSVKSSPQLTERSLVVD